MEHKAVSLASPLARLHVESPGARVQPSSSASSSSSLDDGLARHAWDESKSNGRSARQAGRARLGVPARIVGAKKGWTFDTTHQELEHISSFPLLLFDSPLTARAANNK